MSTAYGAMKMICNNASCINKSIVYRKHDIEKVNRCKSCQWPLIAYVPPRVIRQDAKAKRELEEQKNSPSIR